MPEVWFPSLLRDLTSGQEKLHVAGLTLGEIIEELDRLHPGIRARLCEGEIIRSDLAVVIDSEVSRSGWRQPVRPDSEIHFVPALGGG